MIRVKATFGDLPVIVAAARHWWALSLTAKAESIYFVVSSNKEVPNVGQTHRSPALSGGIAQGEIIAPGAVRAQHQSVLLRLLWAHREISRAELARLTGLSRSSVSAIVHEILASDIVRETRAGSSNGGRKPIMLGFNDDARTVLGLDIGATHVGGVLINLRGRVIARREWPLMTREAPYETLTAASELGHELLQEGPGSLLGVGVGVPAPIHPQSRRVFSTVMPAWHNIDFAGVIERSFRRPVRVNNDANLGALAEQWWGAGRGGQDLVFVKVATGIGAGLIIGGQIVTGANGVAGELGHLSIDPNGPPCVCGVNGCLNVIIGTAALLARTEARLPHFPDSTVRRHGVSLRGLIDAAREGDPLALEIVGFAGERLGEGLANLLNVLDPSTIVLGGDLTQVGEPLLTAVRRTVLRRTLVSTGGDAKVVASQIDKQSVALGAATLILRAALDKNEIPLEASKETA